jgi:hypothetical protein
MYAKEGVDRKIDQTLYNPGATEGDDDEECERGRESTKGSTMSTCGNSDDIELLTSQELIIRSLKCMTNDEDNQWNYITELRKRGTRDVFEKARNLLGGDLVSQRLGCEILAQLGFMNLETTGCWPYREETLPLLREKLNSDSAEILNSTIIAFHHLGAEADIEAIARHGSHIEPQVRFAVAVALGGFDGDLSIDTLINLSRDSDSEVRNWATFGIGEINNRKDQCILDALYDRLDDEHDDTRAEAMIGLAVKGDNRVVDAIEKELNKDTLMSLAIRAAGAVGERRFLPILNRWRGDFGNDPELGEFLADAIVKCSK